MSNLVTQVRRVQEYAEESLKRLLELRVNNDKMFAYWREFCQDNNHSSRSAERAANNENCTNELQSNERNSLFSLRTQRVNEYKQRVIIQRAKLLVVNVWNEFVEEWYEEQVQNTFYNKIMKQLDAMNAKLKQVSGLLKIAKTRNIPKVKCINTRNEKSENNEQQQEEEEEEQLSQKRENITGRSQIDWIARSNMYSLTSFSLANVIKLKRTAEREAINEIINDKNEEHSCFLFLFHDLLVNHMSAQSKIYSEETTNMFWFDCNEVIEYFSSKEHQQTICEKLESKTTEANDKVDNQTNKTNYMLRTHFQLSEHEKQIYEEPHKAMQMLGSLFFHLNKKCSRATAANADCENMQQSNLMIRNDLHKSSSDNKSSRSLVNVLSAFYVQCKIEICCESLLRNLNVHNVYESIHCLLRTLQEIKKNAVANIASHDNDDDDDTCTNNSSYQLQQQQQQHVNEEQSTTLYWKEELSRLLLTLLFSCKHLLCTTDAHHTALSLQSDADHKNTSNTNFKININSNNINDNNDKENKSTNFKSEISITSEVICKRITEFIMFCREHTQYAAVEHLERVHYSLIESDTNIRWRQVIEEWINKGKVIMTLSAAAANGNKDQYIMHERISANVNEIVMSEEKYDNKENTISYTTWLYKFVNSFLQSLPVEIKCNESSQSVVQQIMLISHLLNCIETNKTKKENDSNGDSNNRNDSIINLECHDSPLQDSSNLDMLHSMFNTS